MVWLAGREVSTTECPVSYVTGASRAWLEDFYAQEALGAGSDLEAWPARRVDAFLVLKAERKKTEAERRG